MYSPMIPKTTSTTPLKNRLIATIDAQPSPKSPTVSFTNHDIEQVQKAYDGNCIAQIGRDTQRLVRKRGNRVGSKFRAFFERILCLAREAFLAHILDARLLKADPAHEPTDVAVFSLIVFHCVAHLTVNQSEVARIGRDVNVRQRRQKAVEHLRRHLFKHGFPFTRKGLPSPTS